MFKSSVAAEDFVNNYFEYSQMSKMPNVFVTFTYLKVVLLKLQIIPVDRFSDFISCLSSRKRKHFNFVLLYAYTSYRQRGSRIYKITTSYKFYKMKLFFFPTTDPQDLFKFIL